MTKHTQVEAKSKLALMLAMQPAHSGLLAQQKQEDQDRSLLPSEDWMRSLSSANSSPIQPSSVNHSFGAMAIGPMSSPVLQRKLAIGQPNDQYEQEADRVPDQVMRMPTPKIQRLCPECKEELQRQPMAEEEKKKEEEETLQTKPLAESITPLIQRQMEPTEEEKKKEEETLQTKPASDAASTVSPALQNQITALQGGGQPLPESECHFFEPRFGTDFSQVRIHANGQAAEAARSVNARAFTLGRDVVFGAEQYQPRSTEGQRLLAHELTHVVQQGDASKQQSHPRFSCTVQSPRIQRTLGDGHDLASPRFSKLLDLEAAYDGETIIRKGSTGRGVQAIQQALYDIRIRLRNFGADGDFGKETKAAVKAFQRRNPPLVENGEVGAPTMAALDARFPTPTLPPAAALAAPWSKACVRSVLCPWSPHTIDVLKTRITLKSFDSISWADERWDGAAWVPAPFPGGGYNTGTEIGVLNSSCEDMSETLYHEVLHAEQPRTHRTLREKELYAYRIGEEFSIAMGLGGRPGLRSTDAQGREFADPTKVNTSVASTYPSIPVGGGGDEIIGKAATFGHVRVQRPNGSIYTRPAVVGEKVEGPMTTVNEVRHPRTGWACP